MRTYSLFGQNLTVAGATTLVCLHPGTTAALRIVRAWCGQSANATSAQQRIQFVKQVTVFPTVTGQTPSKLAESDPVSAIISGTAGAAGTCGVNASGEGAGAKTVIMEDVFNVLNGWLWVPRNDDEKYVLAPSSASSFGLYFPAAPATLTGWSFGINYEEIG